MPIKDTAQLDRAPRQSLDTVTTRMAKVETLNVQKKDEVARQRFGRVLARSVELAGLIDKEAAARLKVDFSQFSRWLLGKENGQVWRWHDDELLGPALIAAQAEVTEGAIVRTVIELRRKVG